MHLPEFSDIIFGFVMMFGTIILFNLYGSKGDKK
jgi:hypothetical protein